MPTKGVAVGVSQIKALEADPSRTLIILGNPDTTAIIFYSDRPGVASSGASMGLPVFPQSSVALSRLEGWNCRDSLYIISDTAAKTLAVGEGFDSMPVAGGGGQPRPGTIDPPM